MNGNRRALCAGLIVCAGVAGCAPYTQVKQDLVGQSIRGVRLVPESLDQRQLLVEALMTARRRQIDSAFDADARSVALSAEWVIDARKAYAVAIDTGHAQLDAARRAHDAAVANLDATERALSQLQLLHEIERRLAFPEIKP
jgi:hypothetical protein